MTHLDLFSGIGGFALAADRVWGDVEHIFVEIDPFCQKVLAKHWPESEIYGDIRTVTNTNRSGSGTPTGGIDTDRQTLHEGQEEQPQSRISGQVDLLTGGFPCQPFSQAGKRGGTADNRYLWPEMFRVIREFKPTWVIAENVRGLLTWNEGLVFEQVCADLESEDYQVQPFIIPACSVNAPHRRDRVWFVANRKNERMEGVGREEQENTKHSGQVDNDTNTTGERLEGCNRTPVAGCTQGDSHAQDTISQRGSGRLESNGQILERQSPEIEDARSSWEANWTEVAAELCRVDDGLSSRVVRFPDGGKISYAKWRQESLKALGNAIVPQVAEQIMRGFL